MPIAAAHDRPHVTDRAEGRCQLLVECRLDRLAGPLAKARLNVLAKLQNRRRGVLLSCMAQSSSPLAGGDLLFAKSAGGYAILLFLQESGLIRFFRVQNP